MNMKSVLIFCCSALVSTSLSVNADLLGADKLIEELASSEKTEVYYDRVKAADGSPLDETSVVDSEKYQKLIVTTKNETDEQILYEDCERKVEYIVSSEDRSTCYVHNMTEDEVVRLCFRREETYKKGSKNPKQTVIDGYTIGGESQSKPKLLPEMCANKKVFTLIPKLDKKFGKPEKSDSEVVDARFFGFYCCCNRYQTQQYCCGYCTKSGWWGRRTRYCCGGRCTRTHTVRRCGFGCSC